MIQIEFLNAIYRMKVEVEQELEKLQAATREPLLQWLFEKTNQ